MHKPQSEPTVLIVDENPLILMLVSTMLENHGFRALRARSGAEAQSIAARLYVPIDIALCDVDVAGESGPGIITHVKEFRRDLAVIYMSATVEPDAVRIGVMRQQAPESFTPADGENFMDVLKNALPRTTLGASA